jgi:aminoglycoside phosphotransferase (APT) family kinase protein
MHEDQLYIDADTGRTMIIDQFPAYREEVIEKLETAGTENAIFRIGSIATARFPLRIKDAAESADTLRAEAAAMSEFAQHSPFPAPKPIAFGHPSAAYPMPWLVQSWLEGDIATPNALATSTAFALDIAHLIQALREVDTQGRTFCNQGRGGRLIDHDNWIATCLKNSAGLLDVSRLHQIWIQLRELPPSGPDAMCHGDLTPMNMLVLGERLVGVLDSGGFGPADPALDLVAVWHLFDHERRETVRNCLGSSEIEWMRGAAWAFQQAIGLVWYYQASNPTMSALGRSTLSRILADPGF